jgi:hypothetical protein
MASNSTLVFATQPIAGVDLDSKSSTATFPVLMSVFANDGRKHIYLKANGSLGSTANCTVGASGSAVSAASAGVANSYVINTTGGVVTGQYFWARSNTV